MLTKTYVQYVSNAYKDIQYVSNAYKDICTIRE